jgi:dGTP triphosphohydrolase
MGKNIQSLIPKYGLQRAVCDHLACMTDRFAILEHERLFGS